MYQYPQTNLRRFIIFTAIWVCALLVALLVDGRVANWAYWHAADRDHIGNEILKMPGEFPFTVAVALALLTWHPTTWRAAGHLALSGLLGGGIYSFLKWSAGRTRPVKIIAPFQFQPFINGWSGFMKAENLSFPSGHVTLAFATAACLAINIPRWRYLFYAIAAAVGIERVCENAHYVSDVVAGAGVGTISAYLIHWIERALHRRALRRRGQIVEEPLASGLPAA